MLDDIDLKSAKPTLGTHKANPITYRGVDVSVRPDVILQSNAGVGGLKLHFPKGNPLNAQAAGYMVVDVASGKFFPGVTSTKARLREVEGGCGEVAALWPSIQP